MPTADLSLQLFTMPLDDELLSMHKFVTMLLPIAQMFNAAVEKSGKKMSGAKVLYVKYLRKSFAKDAGTALSYPATFLNSAKLLHKP